MPAAVVHGSADKMVHVSGGRATARAIPGAELLVIDGMGHDMPSELFATFTDVIRRTADRADVSRLPGPVGLSGSVLLTQHPGSPRATAGHRAAPD